MAHCRRTSAGCLMIKHVHLTKISSSFPKQLDKALHCPSPIITLTAKLARLSLNFNLLVISQF